MKRVIRVVISLLLIAAVLLPIAASAEITKVEVTKGTVLRAKPDAKGAKVKNVKAKEQYMYVNTKDKWYEVRLDDNTTGYLAKNTAKKVKSKSIPTGSAKKAFATISAATNQKSNFVTELPESFSGKIAIGVFTDRNGKPVELSTDVLAEEGSYRSIPEELLATNMKEADWALMVYPVIRKSEDNPYSVLVFPVSMKKAVIYSPYYIDNRETVLENGETSFSLDPMLRDIEESVIYPKIKSKVEMLNDEDYQAGLQYMKDKKYFSAYEAFGYSSLKEAENKAKQCIQKWPKNGQIWRNSSVKGNNLQLVVQINQDKDRAILLKIYKGKTHVSNVFIGGSGKTTIKLPSGTYTIKDGTGKQWFGTKEAFGRYGNYEVMTFNNGSEKVSLKGGYKYTLRINVSDAGSKGDSVGSRYQSWEGF